MLRPILIILTLLASVFVLQAQDPTNTILRGQDTIFVSVNEKNQVIYNHQIKAKQTIYSLAKTFGCKSKDIFQLNKINPDSIIGIGQIIQVPISTKYIDKTIQMNYPKAIPIVYIVKPKETLYSIAKKIFHQPIENMIARNELPSFTLSINQKLVVGYLAFELDIENIAEKENIASLSEIKKSPLTLLNYEKEEFIRIMLPEIDSTSGLQKDLLNQFDSLTTEDILVPIISRGIAKWDKNGQDQSNMFVMHRDAKINSIIKLRNPMNNRTVEARVVGHIQSQLVTDDIKVIMSPAVAKKLGIIDKRAQVEMTYFEE